MGAANAGGMMPIQQQGAFGNMPQSAQNLQPGAGMVPMQQNTQQSHPNFQQQRQQNQQ